MIAKDELLNVFARKFHEYKPVAGKLSLQKAGNDKANNYDLIYSGGFLAALALDIEIHEATKNKNRLIDALKIMHRDFAIKDKKFTTADVQRIAEALSNRDFSSFFADYIEGNKIIPFEKYVDSLGLSLSTNADQTILKKKARARSFEKLPFQK